MKLDKPSAKLKQVKGLDGLITVTFEHEIKASTALVDCQLPKIDPAEWNKVLAFLAWSYQTTHSEAQLRGFLNTKTRQWRFWAFPQICGTGMTTKEIDTPSPERTAQRAQFPDPDWIPFATIHHHCSAPAFQSGTDEQDEKIQDGLHITLGHVDQKQYDIHCRFYLGGHRFDPDMSLLWDLGDVFRNVPDWIMRYIPAGLGNELARKAMCIPPPAGTAFPDEWKANLIERPKPEAQTQVWSPDGGVGWERATRMFRKNGHFYRTAINTEYDFKRALQAAAGAFGCGGLLDLNSLSQLFEEAQVMVEMADIPLADLFEFCHEYDVTLEKFNEWLQHQMELKRDQEMQLELQAEGGSALSLQPEPKPLNAWEDEDWRGQ